MSDEGNFTVTDFNTARAKKDARTAGNRGKRRARLTEGLDQLSIARAVQQAYGMDNILSLDGCMYLWKGTSWKKEPEESIKNSIIEICEARNTDADNPKEITSVRIDGIYKLLRTESFRAVAFDEPSDTIFCQNGELSLQDGVWSLSPHQRESYRLSVLPTAYEPSAKAPRFIEFLDELFLDDSDATDKKRCVCQFLGYSLTSNCRFQKFMLLQGEGANGKSVLLNLVRKLVGEGNASAVDPSQWDNKFQRAYLVGKYVNTVSEISEGFSLPDGPLKALTDGSPMTVEKKFEQPKSDAVSFAKNWLGCNPMPHSRDVSFAFFRRSLIIKFNRRFLQSDDKDWREGDPAPDVNIDDKLNQELSGVLNLALEGLRSLITRGSFTEPESSKTARNTWQDDCDQVKQFVEDCAKVGDDEGPTEFKVLYSKYVEWARDNAPRSTLSRRTFGQRLDRLKCTALKGAGNTAYRIHVALRLY